MSKSPLILVADDEDDITDALEEIFAERGYRVLTAHDGRRCLELIESERPDLLVLDNMMPHVSGLAVLEQLQARAHAMRVIMISAGYIARDKRHPAITYLRKPFELGQLLKAVDEQFARELEPVEA